MRARHEGPRLLIAMGVALVMAGLCLRMAMNDVSLTYALGLFTEAVVVLVCAFEPFFGCMVYVLLVYLRPADRLVELEPLRLTYVIAAASFGFWLAQYSIRRRPPMVRHRVLLYLVCFLLSALLSWVPMSLTSALQLIAGGVFKSVAVVWLLVNLTRTPNRLRSATWVVVIATTINALQAAAALQHGASDFGTRAAGVGLMDDPNDLALTLVLAVPLTLALWHSERGFLMKLIAACCCAALCFGVFDSRSRGGAMGLMAVLYLDGFQRIRFRNLRLIYAVVGLALGLGVVAAVVASRGNTLGTMGEDASVYDRQGAWVAGLRMMKSHPLTGVGIYNFPDNVDAYGPDYMEQRTLNAHNAWIQVCGEMGVPGFLSFLGLVVHGLLSTLRGRRRLAEVQTTRGQREVTRALTYSLVGWLICAFFLSQAYQPWLFVLLGLIVSAETIANESPPLPAAEEAQAA